MIPDAFLSLSGFDPVLFHLAFLALTGLWAGLQNALAGGGSFITLPALMALGLNSLEANITSTVALYPGQVTAGLLGRRHPLHLERPLLNACLIISLLGGALGGWLLLITPSRIFAQMLPWLVLIATALFAYGSFYRRDRSPNTWRSAPLLLFIQLLIAVYGGYFGGGIGFMMLAALSLAGIRSREAGHFKNLLVAVINTSAVAVLFFSPQLDILHACILGLGALVGFILGTHLLGVLNERLVRGIVVLIGLGLTIGLFLKTP